MNSWCQGAVRDFANSTQWQETSGVGVEGRHLVRVEGVLEEGWFRARCNADRAGGIREARSRFGTYEMSRLRGTVIGSDCAKDLL